MRRRGTSLVDVLAAVTVIAVAGSMSLASSSENRRTAKQMTNSTHLRGIHQACVIYAQGNKSKFPGLDATGDILPGDQIPWRTTGGQYMASRFVIMLRAHMFTPEYMINPADHAIEFEFPDDERRDGNQDLLDTNHFSYSGLQIDSGVADKGRRAEWAETINTEAVVMSDRNTGPDTNRQVSSVWTEYGSGHWRGTYVRNDNSTVFEPTHVVDHTRYADGQANANDNLFVAAGPSDAMMTFHKDAGGREAQAPRDRQVW